MPASSEFMREFTKVFNENEANKLKIIELEKEKRIDFREIAANFLCWAYIAEGLQPEDAKRTFDYWWHSIKCDGDSVVMGRSAWQVDIIMNDGSFEHKYFTKEERADLYCRQQLHAAGVAKVLRNRIVIE